jgi:hypothetical protein
MRKACFCQFILAMDVSHASDDAFETLIAGLIAIRSDTRHADELRKSGKIELVSYIGDDEAPLRIAQHLKYLRVSMCEDRIRHSARALLDGIDDFQDLGYLYFVSTVAQPVSVVPLDIASSLRDVQRR